MSNESGKIDFLLKSVSHSSKHFSNLLFDAIGKGTLSILVMSSEFKDLTLVMNIQLRKQEKKDRPNTVKMDGISLALIRKHVQRNSSQKTNECSLYDIKFHRLARLQSWNFWECGVLFHCQHSQVCSDQEW